VDISIRRRGGRYLNTNTHVPVPDSLQPQGNTYTATTYSGPEPEGLYAQQQQHLVNMEPYPLNHSNQMSMMHNNSNQNHNMQNNGMQQSITYSTTEQTQQYIPVHGQPPWQVAEQTQSNNMYMHSGNVLSSNVPYAVDDRRFPVYRQVTNSVLDSNADSFTELNDNGSQMG